MKSPFFSFFEPFVKRLCRFSFFPTLFWRFFFSFSSSRTRAVNIAVAAFLIPAGNTVGTWVPGVCDLDSGVSIGVGVDSPLACFLRFLEPDAFLRECERPCSASFWTRLNKYCLSASLVGRIGITLSSVYASLHYSIQVIIRPRFMEQYYADGRRDDSYL